MSKSKSSVDWTLRLAKTNLVLSFIMVPVALAAVIYYAIKVYESYSVSP